MRALLLLTGTLLVAGCGGSEDPQVVSDARQYADKAFDDGEQEAYSGALEGDWTRVGAKVVFTEPERRCDDDTVGCSPVVIVVCLEDMRPVGVTPGTVKQRTSELACRPA